MSSRTDLSEIAHFNIVTPNQVNSTTGKQHCNQFGCNYSFQNGRLFAFLFEMFRVYIFLFAADDTYLCES